MSKMLRQNRYPSYYDSSIDDDALDNELATPKNDGLMSKEDKAKLDNLPENGCLEVKASDIVQDENNMFVTQQQIDNWNQINTKTKVDYDSDRNALIFHI